MNFTITFDDLLVGGSSVTLPDELAFGIAYNTGSYGNPATGNTTAGYNSLNVGLLELPDMPSVGTDSANDILWDATYSGRTRGFRIETDWDLTLSVRIATAAACTTDCYVDATNGSDLNHGSQAYPKKTIQEGVAAVQSGGTVHVADGNYTGLVALTKKVSVVSTNRHGATLTGVFHINGNGFTGAVIDGFHIIGNHLMDGKPTAVFIQGNNGGHSIINNHIETDSPTGGPNSPQRVGVVSTASIDGLTIAHNHFQRQAYPIYLNGKVSAGGDNHQIYMNTFEGYYGGVALDGTENTVVRNNLFIGPVYDDLAYPPIYGSAIVLKTWNLVAQTGTSVFANSFQENKIGIRRANDEPSSPLGAPVNANGNWWGGSTGPDTGTNATIAIEDGGVVNATQWLSVGTNNVPLGEPGFIPAGQLFIEDATGLQGATLSVPIKAMGVAPFTGGTVDFTYDPAKVQIMGVAQGSSLPLWGFTVNPTYATNTVRVTFANDVETAPAGVYELGVISVKLLAAPGNTALLDVVTSDLDFNLTPTHVPDLDGVITIAGDMLSGAVRDWGAVAPPEIGVEGVLLTLEDTANVLADLTDLTDAAGAYSIGLIAPGNYTLTPSFGLQVCPALNSCAPVGISGQDAALALNHHAGLGTLTGNAEIAANVNGDFPINTVDATLIMRRASAMIAVWPNSVPLWKFVDPYKTYTFTSSPSNPVNQDFTAILMGDVDGNWVPMTVGSAVEMSDATVSFAHAVPQADGSVSVAVTVNTGSAASVTSLDLDLAFDSSKFVALEPAVAGGWLSSANLDKQGAVILSSASASGAASGSVVVTLKFRPTASDTAVQLLPSTVYVNGRPAQVVDSPLVTPIFRMLIPFVQSAN